MKIQHFVGVVDQIRAFVSKNKRPHNENGKKGRQDSKPFSQGIACDKYYKKEKIKGIQFGFNEKVDNSQAD